jgi:hypothetical protein
MKFRAMAAWAACLLAMPLPARAAQAEPTEAALKIVQGLRARSMGVDRAGNLWAWDALGQKVAFLSPAGERVGSVGVRDASVVDADSAWGVVSLETYGKEIRWVKADGEPPVRIRLASPASGICWTGASTVAVAPETADHRVEIWNLKDRTLIKTLGQEQPLHPTYGATRLRTYVLRYDFERDRLYALESFTGHLQVFALDGKLAWETRVENAMRPGIEKWLVEIDRIAKEGHDVQTPLVWTFWLALAGDGGAWVVGERDAVSGSIPLIKLTAQGNRNSSLPDHPCPRRTFTLWGSWLVFYTDTASGREVCNWTRRVP